MSFLKTPLSILSDNKKFYEEIIDNKNVNNKIIFQLMAMIIFFFIYGFIIGLSSNNIFQPLSSAIKLPILFILTLLVCSPTLYIFNILFGSKLTFSQHLALLLSMQSVTSIFLIAFSPVTLFFLITSKNYQFFKLLNVSIFTISGIIGVYMLNKGIRGSNTFEILSEQDDKRQKTKKRSSTDFFIFLWIVLYGFVGSQLAWILRPFFGDPRLPFELFRNLNGNFYYNIIKAISEILGMK